jgi:hypothetical protein
MNAEALDLWNRAKKALVAAHVLSFTKIPIPRFLVRTTRHFTLCLHILRSTVERLQNIAPWNLLFTRIW